MEAEKSHDLLSAGWRAMKGSGVVQPKPTGLRTKEANGLSPSLSPKAGEAGTLMSGDRRWMSQFKHSKQAHPSRPEQVWGTLCLGKQL